MKSARPGVGRALARAAFIALPLGLVGACAHFGTASRAPAPLPTSVPAAVTPAGEPATAQTVMPRAARLRGPAPDVETSDTLPPIALTPQIMFQLLASEIAAQRGEVGSAGATYLSLARQTRDPRLARRATELALAARSLDRALQGARLWQELSPGSTLAAQMLETLLLSTGQLSEVEPLLAAHLAKAREADGLPEFYGQLARTLSRVSDKAAALALIERLAAPDTSVAQARMAVATIAAAAGMHERAAAESAQALALRPDDEAAAVAAAQFTVKSAAGPQGAGNLLEAFLKRHPRAVEARFAYARLLAAQDRPDDARKQMEQALQEEPDSPAILFSMAQLAYQAHKADTAEVYLRRYVELPPAVTRDNGPAYMFLSQLEQDRDRPAEAVAWLEKITSGDQFIPAVMRRAMLLGKLERVDAARALLRDTAVSSLRERAQLSAAEAQVLREARRFQEAFEVLEAALERAPNNTELLYDHAMAAERIGRIPATEASLRKLIELQPEHAHAYNALGFTLADRNMRLEEAQSLIEKALLFSPDDPHILDSMGWVLFRRGQFDRALEYLKKAYALRPEVEIGVHMGEVLWKMGRTDEARQMWREARTREPANETLKETLARLDVML